MTVVNVTGCAVGPSKPTHGQEEGAKQVPTEESLF